MTRWKVGPTLNTGKGAVTADKTEDSWLADEFLGAILINKKHQQRHLAVAGVFCLLISK